MRRRCSQSQTSVQTTKAIRAEWEGGEHEPAHDAHRIERLADIAAVHDAWVDEAFVQRAAIPGRDRPGNHHRHERPAGGEGDDEVANEQAA